MDMNGYTDTYRHCPESHWEINPSPPLPSIQRFPPSPSTCTSDSPNNLNYPYSRFVFNFDFGYIGSSSPLKSSSSPIASIATLTRPRKAPLPPVYSPRRARARHIRMQEPAKLGLFTVSEEEVGESSGGPSSEETEWYDLSTPLTYSPSYSSSSTSTSTSPSLSESESEVEVETPNGEFDDPFSTPPTTLSITSPFTRPRPPPPTLRTVVPVPTLAAAVNAGNFQPRRPPPLELHLITRPNDLPHLDTLTLSPSPLSFHCQLNSAGRLPLAEALPIRNTQTCTTPLKRRSPDSEVDLVSALEELFTSCGEDLDNVSESSMSIGIDDFPLPPSRSIPSISVSKSKSRSLNASPTSTPLPQFHRTPVTPPPTRLSLSPSHYQPPAAPRQKQRRVDTSRQIRLEGNHSFLLDMSRSPSSSSQSSGSSSGSGRSLPRRGSIPTQWANPI